MIEYSSNMISTLSFFLLNFLTQIPLIILLKPSYFPFPFFFCLTLFLFLYLTLFLFLFYSFYSLQSVSTEERVSVTEQSTRAQPAYTRTHTTKNISRHLPSHPSSSSASSSSSFSQFNNTSTNTTTDVEMDLDPAFLSSQTGAGVRAGTGVRAGMR